MNLLPIWVDVRVPYERAICANPIHRRQRCVLGRTASGLGKRSFLHKLAGESITGPIGDHEQLQQCLYQLGCAFVDIVDREGWQLTGELQGFGPFPAYVESSTRFHGQGPQGFQMDPAAQAHHIAVASGFDEDFVQYRLFGRFLGKGDSLCLDLGEQPTLVPLGES